MFLIFIAQNILESNKLQINSLMDSFSRNVILIFCFVLSRKLTKYKKISSDKSNWNQSWMNIHNINPFK